MIPALMLRICQDIGRMAERAYPFIVLMILRYRAGWLREGQIEGCSALVLWGDLEDRRGVDLTPLR